MNKLELSKLKMGAIMSGYRFVGGLPYRWTTREPPGINLPVLFDEKIIKNKWWIFWSILFAIFIFGYFCYGAYNTLKPNDPCAVTLSVVKKIEDVGNMLSTGALRVQMLGKPAVLAKALVLNNILCWNYGINVKPFYVDKHCLQVLLHILIGYGCICYGNLGLMVANNKFELKRFMMVANASIKPIVLSLIMILYSRLVDLQATAYDDFFDIVRIYPKGAVTFVSSPDNVWTEDNKVVPLPEVEASKEEEVILPQQVDLKKAKKFVLDMYDSMTATKAYFEFLVGLILWHMVLSSIVGCFIVTLTIGSSNGYEWTAKAGLLIMIIFPAVFLTNAPRQLNNSKETVRMEVVKMKMQLPEGPLRTEMTELEDLLSESPEFSMMGYFTLGRARIVDIFGFIATYLVILLQFKVVEVVDDPRCDGYIEEESIDMVYNTTMPTIM